MQENYVESTKQKGDALEKSVEFIFQCAGFDTERNIRIATYEIDVLVRIGDRTIVVECKNYQSSTLTVRNIIHQWNSKNLVVRASKIVIVLAGVSAQQADIELAAKFNIEIWNEEDLAALFNLSLKPSELRERLLQKISFLPITIAQSYRDRLAGFIIRPIFLRVPNSPALSD